VAISFSVSDGGVRESIAGAFRLIHDLQAGVPGAREGLAALWAKAQLEGWDDVERVCIFGEAVGLWIAGESGTAQLVEQLIERSIDAGDNVMLALGFALRSEQGFAAEDLLATAAHDDDLAKAIVMLEQEKGRPCERISAHTACAIALGSRWLFELSREQYEAALAIGAEEPAGSVDFLLVPIRFNLAEEQVSWASKLYELGDEAGVKERWTAWNQFVAATEAYQMTESWRLELAALGLVLSAMVGNDPTTEARALLARIENSEESGRTVGLLRLGIAIGLSAKVRTDTDRRAATEAAGLALSSISATVHPFFYDLALFVAARLEAHPGADAGLRYAGRAAEELWTKRDASLRAMRAQIAAVRVTLERDLLSAHARLDDLTGIANRRALEQFCSDLVKGGVERCAVVLFDVDSFKAVNDVHGHLAGDRLLVRMAQVLARGVRSSDLAVRLGGDEFAVVLADADLDSARSRAEALLCSIDDEPLGDIADALDLRVSAGVAVGSPDAIMAIWAAADSALYRSKALGGHKVEVATDFVS
jgi:diguanylate cyclase (GGDEF)-like protein